MKKLILSFLLAMTVLSSISQTDCKELILINGDTINLYSPSNIKRINKVFTDLDLAEALIKKQEQDALDYIEHIAGINGETRVLGERLALQLSIVNEKEIQGNVLEADNKKLNKKVKVLKKMRNLFTTIGVAVGSTITYLIMKP